jgi:hypothetical protein
VAVHATLKIFLDCFHYPSVPGSSTISLLLHFIRCHNLAVLEVRTEAATETRLLIIQLSGTIYSRRSSGTNEVSNSGNRPRDADTTIVTCHIRYFKLKDEH